MDCSVTRVLGDGSARKRGSYRLSVGVVEVYKQLFMKFVSL